MHTSRLAAILIAASFALNAAELIGNGDFSSGLTGWTVENAGTGLGGEAQTVSSFDGLSPTSGNFALLDTGPSSTYASATPTYARLRQSFTLAAPDSVTIAFILAPLTARFTGNFASELDRFSVSLIPSAGPATTLFSTDLSNPNFQLLSGAPVTSPTGSNFFEALPLTSFSQALNLAAGTYTLQFQVESDQNSLFDSGLLIGNVSVSAGQPTGAVPEPSSMALLGGGVLAFAALRSRSPFARSRAAKGE